jgi:hypothetical protein
MMKPDVATPRLRGWHFLLFNLVLGLAHMAVLFNAASYIAFSSRSLDGDGDRHQRAGTIGLQLADGRVTDEYQTDVYEHELATADSMAEDIILTQRRLEGPSIEGGAVA